MSTALDMPISLEVPESPKIVGEDPVATTNEHVSAAGTTISNDATIMSTGDSAG